MKLTQKWKKLLEVSGEGIPTIDAGSNKSKIMAKVFENQDLDIKTDPSYRDQQLVEAFAPMAEADSSLTEAVVDGDHGYSADNIAKGQTTGAVTNIGPTVMGMIRRAIPQLVAFDIAGVQPMKGPASQVFTLRSVYGADPLDANAKEAFHPFHAPDAQHSGDRTIPAGTATQADQSLFSQLDEEGQVRYYVNLTGGVADVDSTAKVVALVKAGTVSELNQAMATSVAELQEGYNGSSSNPWAEMSFRIDKQVVEAKSRQLKASYSIELAQDLKAVHGLDADAELSSILANEVMVEINREVLNLINAQAQLGKSGWTKGSGSAGVFDFADAADVRGARWAGESYKALIIQIEKEANEIARQTGRGAGNFILASRNVVSALSMTDMLIGPAAQGAQSGALNTDTSKAVFAGILAGRFKVYIDQYAQTDYFTVGYKGGTELDAGVYYCPYVPLTPLRGADSKNFQPVMGFKTRYGIQVNPFSDNTSEFNAAGQKIALGDGKVTLGKNCYFRKVFVTGL